MDSITRHNAPIRKRKCSRCKKRFAVREKELCRYCMKMAAMSLKQAGEAKVKANQSHQGDAGVGE